jgi:hypothetical protein
MPPTALSHNGKVALAYAKAGFYVFPCSAERKKREPADRLPFGKADKRPLVTSWSKEASKDEKQIQQWWTEHPEALVGLPCKQNRLFVVDTDRHTATADGVANFAALCEGRNEAMPPHPVIGTDYEGEHHAFRMPDEPIGQGKNKLPPGVDIRGYRHDNDGGYIIAAGSRMADGRGWRRLDGTPSLRDPLPLPPQWLIELCTPPTPQASAAPTTHKSPGKAEEAYAMAALNRAAAELAQMPPNTGRDNKLLSVAGTMGRMIAPGWIGQATVEGRLFDACRSNGLADETGDREILDKIRRGIEATLSNPHSPLPERPKEGDAKEKGNGHSTSGAINEHWRDGMFSARELCVMRFAPLKFIVPKIIPEGLTILAGRPKIGKSWLVLLLGTVLANGVAALGLDYGMTVPLKGSVLYLGLEDGKRRLQRRMTKLVGIRPENWPEQLYLKTDWRRFDQGGLDDIRAWHAAAKAKGEAPLLVVVDTLAKVRAPGNSKSSPYQNDHDALAELQRLAEELGIAVVVNHHDRKMDAEDIFDTVSGTLGLTGAVDTILVLAKKAQGTTLHIRGRDIEDETALALRFDRESCRWSVLGTAASQEEANRSEERRRILTALAGKGDGLSVTEIMVAAELRNRNATDILLFKMKEAGEIAHPKRGLYCLPEYAGKIGKKERLDDEVTENKAESGNLSNLSDLSGDTAPPPVGKINLGNSLPRDPDPNGNGAADLTIPDYLRATIDAGGRPPGQMAANGFAISATPENRKPPEPGQLTARVWIREIRPPALGPPGDDLNDFVR